MEDPDSMFTEIRKKSVQAAIDAGFTESQAEFLLKRFETASMGFGGMFL